MMEIKITFKSGDSITHHNVSFAVEKDELVIIGHAEWVYSLDMIREAVLLETNSSII